MWDGVRWMCSSRSTPSAAQQVQITLNRPVVEGYLNAMRSMVQEYGVTDDISVTALAKMPEVFLVEKPQTDEEQLKADLLGVVEQALEAYDRMRATEGAALEADLRSRGQTILALVAQVEQASPRRWQTTGIVWKENPGSAGEQVHRRVPDPNGSSHLCRQGRRG